MRLSHLLLAAATLLPLSAQAITLDKLGGRWVNTDVTCKTNPSQEEFCEFVIIPKNKSMGEFYLSHQGKRLGKVGLIAVTDEDVWTVSYNGEVVLDLEYEDGMLYDPDDAKYHRVSR